MKDMTTTNFADFGWQERRMAAELLTASCDQGFPVEFQDDGVVIMMNRYSGNVFFTNSDFQVCMMNGDKLEMFHSCSMCGHEDFASDHEWHDAYTCKDCAEDD
jgi:hypothetical protein